MISLSPKAQFQANADAVKFFASVAHNDHFHTALKDALAEFVYKLSPSQEQLNGVKVFLGVLLNMAEKDKAVPNYPTRKLDHNPNAEPTKTETSNV